MTEHFLSKRSQQPELMDAPDIDPAELDLALHHLQTVNRWLNGYKPSEQGIERLLPSDTSDFSLLDVGCGSGDTLREIAMWARWKKITARLTGIELSAHSAARARQLSSDFPEITIKHQDVFSLHQGEQFDIVHCALVLHHFPSDDAAVRLLSRMNDAARLGIVVNDLHRHPVAYHSIKVLTRAFSRSRVLQNDAPLSVARAFTKKELYRLANDAGLQNVTVEWHWAFRWLMISRKIDAGSVNP